MDIQIITREKKTFKIVFFIMAAVLLTAISAGADSAAKNLSFIGKVIAINKDVKTIAVDPFDKKMAGRTFVVNKNISITKEEEQMSFEDINVGDLVTVRYHREINNMNIIDGIAITSQAAERQV